MPAPVARTPDTLVESYEPPVEVSRQFSDGQVRRVRSYGEAFNANFGDQGEAIAATLAGRRAPVGQKYLGAEAMAHQNEAYELMTHMEALGWSPVTLVNLNPFPITIADKMHNITLPACRPEDKFGRAVLRDYAIDCRDKGNNLFSMKAFPPKLLIRDFLREVTNNKWAENSVFVYEGDFDPMNPPYNAIETAEFKTWFQKKMDLAIAAVNVWCKRMIVQADTEYNRANGNRAIIGELHRASVHWRIGRGFLKEQDRPKWSDYSTDDLETMSRCPACKSQVAQGIPQCTNCNFIIDPVFCYVNGMIGKEHASLSKLTRKELDALGLKDVESRAYLLGRTDEDSKIVTPPKPASAPKKVTAEETGEETVLEDEADLDAPSPEDAAKLAELTEAASGEQPGAKELDAQTTARLTEKQLKAAAKAKEEQLKADAKKTKEQKEAEKAI